MQNATRYLDRLSDCNQNGCIYRLYEYLAMASVTIKGVPDELLVRLRARAAMEKRSMNKQVICLLEFALADGVREGVTSRHQLAQAQADAWLRLSGRWDSALPIVDEIEEIYATRTAGRNVDL